MISCVTQHDLYVALRRHEISRGGIIISQSTGERAPLLLPVARAE